MDIKSYTVYMHVSPNNKKYIGITSTNVKKRWGSNGINYKNNDHFYRAISKYGWNNFQHIILFENLDYQQAKIKEIELIEKYNTFNFEFGYNKSLGGEPCNRRLTDEEKKKRAKECYKRSVEKNKEHYLEYRRKYDKTDKRRQQANERNKTPKRREHRRLYMQKWREKNKEKLRKNGKEYYYKKRENVKDGRKVKVFVYNKEMKLLFISNSIKECSQKINLSVNFINNCCKGIKNSKNYIFRKEKLNDNSSRHKTTST